MALQRNSSQNYRATKKYIGWSHTEIYWKNTAVAENPETQTGVDLDTFSIFAQTGVSTRQRMSEKNATFSALWGLSKSSCYNATLKSALELVQLQRIELQNSESHISNEVISAKLCTFATLNSW